MTRPTDPTEAALRQLRKFGEGVADSADGALGAWRADCDHATRVAAVTLHLRRLERLCRDILQSVPGVRL
jgi:hypothetical protein